MVLKRELERERERKPGCLGTWVQLSTACLLPPPPLTPLPFPSCKWGMRATAGIGPQQALETQDPGGRGVLLMDYWAVCSHHQLGQACSAALSRSWRNSGGEVLSSRSVQDPALVCGFQLCPFTVLARSLCVLSQDGSDLRFPDHPALASYLHDPAWAFRNGKTPALRPPLPSAAVLLTEPLCLPL